MATVVAPDSHPTESPDQTDKHETEGGNSTLHGERIHNVQLDGMWKEALVQKDFTRPFDA